MNINEMTDVELKALGFDLFQQIQIAQQNLNIINQTLAKRAEIQEQAEANVPAPKEGE